MKFNIRNGVRIFFLLLIFALWYLGKVQMWGPLLGISLLLVPFAGRIYCGWVCPIFTTMDIMKPVLKKPLFKVNKQIIQNRYLKILLLLIYGLLLFLFIKTNFFIPFFIFLIPVGVLITYLFGEVFWHRFCFFGMIFSLFSKFSLFGYKLNPNICRKCNACVRKCPNDCIITNKDSYYIDKKHCLICDSCKEICPVSAIDYGNTNRKTNVIN
ncbi:4Fe-4S binding domain-containing protein [Desulfonispora thiosulfatigenes DSM 11270]|uniref:4Fe-4S binding domain-containing protein n=1 Tax=Desulfonispora thiosulfatigenes DSM 11270 TaxID=656914 RepID=A0A1W1UJ66_DESTI|nr:4Fe-4S binding protein [Desulfonispora thiosulfatigenes]SMB81082.1 4Fe-4S binding domain-containing protein [Desulfonispora thiosulfatigenes DSM 11270]